MPKSACKLTQDQREAIRKRFAHNGNIVSIQYPIGLCSFVAGKDAPESRVETGIDDGSVWTARVGEVKLACGVIVPAILEFCESDSNEHWGTGFLLAGGQIAFQGEEGFLELMQMTDDQIFPYMYRYFGPPCERDHHVGDDGWSR